MSTEGANRSELSCLRPSRYRLGINTEEIGDLARGEESLCIRNAIHSGLPPSTINDVRIAPLCREVSGRKG